MISSVLRFSALVIDTGVVVVSTVGSTTAGSLRWLADRADGEAAGQEGAPEAATTPPEEGGIRED